MAVSTIKTAPPHSVVLISDLQAADVPESMQGSVISATPSCVAVGCLSEVDGQTEFVIGPTTEVNPGHRPTFEGELETPMRRVVLRTVLGQTLLGHEVSHDRTRVRVWLNHESEPDRVVVGLEE